MGCFLKIVITCLIVNLILPNVLPYTSDEVKGEYTRKRCYTFFYDWFRCCFYPWACIQNYAQYEEISDDQEDILGMSHNFLSLNSKSAS